MNEFDKNSELWNLLETPGLDPVAIAEDLWARLKPKEPKSELRYKLAYITLVAQLNKNRYLNLSAVQPYFDTVLQLGLSSNDIGRQVHATWNYGAILNTFQQFDEAATYCLLAVQLTEKYLPEEVNYDKCIVLAKILFQTEDYRPCIEYGVKALESQAIILKKEVPLILALHLNTIGQAYYRMGMSDSAAFYYKRSKQLAAKQEDAQWVGINASFEGQLYLEMGEARRALSLFEEGYFANKYADPPMVSFSLMGMGQSLFKLGESQEAKLLLWQALGAAERSPGRQRWQVAYYRKDALATLAGVYRQQNRPDSFYYYSLEADRLEDSMVKVISLSNLRMAQIKGEVEHYRMQASRAAEKEQRTRLWRNLIIVGIVVAASVIILLLSRQNRILQLKRQMAEVKQQAADAEIAAARKQLDLFTHSLHEKTRLLEQLQQQDTTDGSVLHLQMMQDLTRQAILTEEDWQFFRTSFDKIYPPFFMRLRQAAPDITMAEQRMAALTLLNINNKEIATILGISPESVRKTRQRLRQRLQLDTQDDLASCLQRLA